MNSRLSLTGGKTWVIKIGSSLLTDNGRGLNKASIASWVKDMASLRNAGVNIVLVSSGAVAEGVARLGMNG